MAPSTQSMFLSVDHIHEHACFRLLSESKASLCVTFRSQGQVMRHFLIGWLNLGRFSGQVIRQIGGNLCVTHQLIKNYPNHFRRI